MKRKKKKKKKKHLNFKKNYQKGKADREELLNVM